MMILPRMLWCYLQLSLLGSVHIDIVIEPGYCGVGQIKISKFLQ